MKRPTGWGSSSSLDEDRRSKRIEPMIGSIVCHGREGAGGARTVADGSGNVLAMLYGMRAMSLVAHPHCQYRLEDKCKQRSRPSGRCP